MLVHDLLLTKRGISAPSSHPLRLAVERHKARLNAELTKARLRRGLPSIEALRAQIEAKDGGEKERVGGGSAGTGSGSGAMPVEWPHPRWVRVNTIKSDVDEQLRTTFADYKPTESLEGMLKYALSAPEKLIHVDKHVPNLLALPSDTDLSKIPAYLDGEIIIQDKASCFPAYLLSPRPEDGDCLDACAAPGNKTTHLAAILHERRVVAKPKIYACERDKGRASTMLALLRTAGAERHVTVKAGQDFLKIDPLEAHWVTISTLLLDPSCSGSGIVGRDEALNVVLPSKEANDPLKLISKKRKRKPIVETKPVVHEISEENLNNNDKTSESLSARLTALSTFQLKLLLHAFHFPNASRITYSTCSTHAEENEHVVMKAIESSIARERGWRMLRREEQASGMKAWKTRGKVDACRDVAKDETINELHIAEACIRCEKGTKEGTQGFFVAGFVRPVAESETEQLMDEEWEGFSDSGSIY